MRRLAAAFLREAWFARGARSTNVFNVVPAYSPWEVVEFSVPLARNRTDAVTAIGALLRVRITEPQKSGCNFLVALGQQHQNPGGNQPYAYSAATCRKNEFALHANLGAAKPSGASSFGTWGIGRAPLAGRCTGGKQGRRPPSGRPATRRNGDTSAPSRSHDT